MKKQIPLLLAIIMLLYLSACSGTSVPTATEKPPVATEIPVATEAPPLSDNAEINRAAEYGFLPSDFQGDWDAAITYGQFCTMIGNMLALKDASFTAPWQEAASLALVSDKKMLRQEGMLALFYAAQIMGIKGNGYSWGSLFDAIGEPWDSLTWNYPLFPNWKDKAVFDQEWKDRMTAAYFFSLSMQSPISGKLIFDYDEVSNSMRLSDALTREEAIQAVLRLYESTLAAVERTPVEWDTEFLASADACREGILASETSVTYTGTAYYVSNSGNDSGDGKTESAAWATLDKVNSAKLKPGDAVFFQRGGLWRGYLTCKEGVTYSAYGEGDKPKIYGSPENGAGAEKWALLEGTDNIWVFYRDMQDAGAVVFNDGESWADKKVTYWDGSKYVSTDDYSTEFDVKTLDDLSFFSGVDMKGSPLPVYMYEHDFTGKLYLRCDEGNPGEVYSSIEFLTDIGDDVCIVKAADGCVIDNLNIRYGGNCGVALAQQSKLQNCEVAWFGGMILSYNNLDSEGYGGVNGGDVIIRAGDGVQMGGVDNTAVNNYIHDIYDYGLTIETGYRDYFPIPVMKNLNFKGNIIECCNGGAAIINWESEADENHRFSNIVLEDNFFLYTGYGWSHAQHIKFGQLSMSDCLMFFDAPNVNDGIYITKNVFYLSRYALINCHMPQEYWPVFSGNTYVQNAFGYLMDYRYKNMLNKTSISADGIEALTADILGDKTAVIIPPN